MLRFKNAVKLLISKVSEIIFAYDDEKLTKSMIPLGSCTMKLNSATELFALSWPSFSNLHPFAPLNQTRGYSIMFHELEEMLCEITALMR